MKKSYNALQRIAIESKTGSVLLLGISFRDLYA